MINHKHKWTICLKFIVGSAMLLVLITTAVALKSNNKQIKLTQQLQYLLHLLLQMFFKLPWKHTKIDH